MLKIIKKLILLILIITIIFLIKYSIMFMASKIFLRNNKKKLMKKIILSKIFKYTFKNIKKVNSLFIKRKGRFGNFFLSINKAIKYCEILNCKQIIIEKNNNIFINKRIFYNKGNFTIETNEAFNLRDNYSINLDYYYIFINSFGYFRNINKLKIFREQLLNNLPKVLIHPYDLYIYIRSGDIFVHAHRNYNQPPLCFYAKILDLFKFNKVYIISENKLNPVIPILMRKYSYLKKTRNNVKLDISYLINSYNMVEAKSTFFSTSIQLNNKLKFLWSYDFDSSSSRVYLDFHFIIYKMNSSINYRTIMKPWTNSPRQRRLMIEEKCLNNFDIIKND